MRCIQCHARYITNVYVVHGVHRLLAYREWCEERGVPLSPLHGILLGDIEPHILRQIVRAANEDNILPDAAA